MSEPIWSYVTPGIPDELFERLPGIPMSKCETRLLILGQLRLKVDSILWDIGAGTGTIPVEIGLLCPKGKIVAIERDEDVAGLIATNCKKFDVNNVEIRVGSAPECLTDLTVAPDRICIEGGRSVSEILEYGWERLQFDGRAIATTNSLEGLYAISESFAKLHARNVEVVQSSVNRLETRGNRQVFAAVSPIFIISGEKI
ncbi:MAG: precorrin-6Y C5,15-methyltransferase subunit CbiT [Pseudanabaena sp.]|jgi:cobalt-precorrin-6B (C15)-methyltransferase|uniref:precorrin-6Y C5,15-methyltransferase subunit CbiT n=1 Tax=Pseudanabaena mucicola TaxID=71190 RepID=UPI002574F0D5|nr:precorrin-6Y C5,15-methyltransferase subunit CbiT [Pseudanabaena mucicola]MCA6585710.1 precorrin-6Y C5,15-methyltransferase subunit CbiT [Pseudanabaena sp. M051S1SP1A06QC]MCA6605655.1 precorrin-6Y C5,15-methyltransferase subunit CbiT [Pseudanabaena sp. M007S1SP1A06QC]MCA6612306.1 precorrin-6Y C5,15-methyltransferase subunit CbiT [Pseudanabaena sp. M158S2SP1A06QC]MCA6613855.1 precorrin-6Y C5,15-methyltransferase subunit CbiT [Pseudanabaena sp. M090S1SP1A06QC]MCA6622039.1 precorrin-6Y C5,15-m